MSYRVIKDKDEEQAKQCLNCGKIFYVGNKCPFCKEEKIEQNLIKAICPDCGKKVKNIIGWVNVVNKNVIPANLPEERCPECLLEVLKKNDMYQQVVPLIII